MPNGKMKIAIVDDDLSVRKALGRLLTANSLDVQTYGSAREFLESLAVRKPDCLVLDLHMPDYGGLALQHYLRRKGIIVPTVIITAHNEIGLREHCANAGAGAFLVKPLAETVLIDSIYAAVQDHTLKDNRLGDDRSE
jgi:FixJ family two-component response regulator